MSMRIVFAGGGTLGSVTPLLAAAQAIRTIEPAAEFFWVGTAAGPEAALVRAAGIPFYAVSSGKLRRYWSWRNFSDFGRIVKGFWDCWRLFGRLRPDVLISAGSFVAVPAVWAAWVRRVPVHLHQMDIRPGLANKLSAPCAASISVTFAKSLRDFVGRQPVWTGNPIRPELLAASRQEAAAFFGLEPAVPTLLVLGGGTGAVGLNELARQAVPFLTEAVQVIHLTGRGKVTPFTDAPARYHRFEFLAAEMRWAYAAADLVVTRAGMGVLTELAALGRPSVIIPMPDSHQEENAAFFAAAGAAVVADERRLSPRGFADLALGLLADHDRLANLAAGIGRLNRPDAAARLAGIILTTARSGCPTIESKTGAC